MPYNSYTSKCVVIIVSAQQLVLQGDVIGVLNQQRAVEHDVTSVSAQQPAVGVMIEAAPARNFGSLRWVWVTTE